MDVLNFIDQLKRRVSEELPGEMAHLRAMPVSRPLSSEAKRAARDNYRSAAVSILLYPEFNTIKGVLIQRPEYDGAHGGQVSFPGGKIEPEDINPEAAARRECYEEIGFPIHHGEFVGILTEVFIPVSQFLVLPHVFYTENLPPLTPDPREVYDIIHFDLMEFTSMEIETTTINHSSGMILKNVPFFPIEGKTVWGATALILAELQEILKKID